MVRWRVKGHRELSVRRGSEVGLEKVKLRELRGLRVLIVEDHPEVARLFSVLLREHGSDVQICSAGDQAIGAAVRFDPDVVLLDIRLPGLDGYHVATQLLSGDLRRRPLIIAITAYSQDRYRDQAAAAGIDLFLTKPVSGRELMHWIEETPLREDVEYPTSGGDSGQQLDDETERSG